MACISSLHIVLVAILALALQINAGVIKRVDPPPLRDVYLQISVDLDLINARDGNPAGWDPQQLARYASHVTMDIVGDGFRNGNVRIGFGYVAGHGYVPLVEDFNIYIPNEVPVSGISRNQYTKAVKIGSININNVDLLDPTTGKGKVTDVWSRNTGFSVASHNNVDFVNDVITELRLDPGQDFRQLNAENHAPRGPSIGPSTDYVIPNRPLVSMTYVDSNDADVKNVALFDVTNSNQPRVIQRIQETAIADPLAELLAQDRIQAVRPGSPDVEFDSIQNWFNFASTEAGGGPVAGDIQTAEDLATISRSDSGLSGAESLDYGPRRLDPYITMEVQPTTGSMELPVELAVVRSGGIVYTIASIAKTALIDVAGALSIATLPFFIVLDLIHGNWQAAVVGAAAGIAGIAAGLLASGPIGLLVGAAIGILFSIIPGLFQEKANPTTTNPAQIIQFSFFGDRDHTGNEGCNKQRTDAGQKPNCTALYGAGTISHIFNWNIFDAMVFLLEHNNGHPMSIIDMAAVLPIQDYTVSSWSANRSSYIDCGAAPPPQPLPGYNGAKIPGYHVDNTPASGYDCPKPKYHLNRTLIKLAALNGTADQIYSRIIPAPNGDCKLYSDPVNGVNVPFFNLQVTGRPVGIECGLFANATVGVDPGSNLYSTTPNLSVNTTTYSSGTAYIFNATTNSTQPFTNATSNATNSNLMNTTTVSTDNSTLRAYRTPPSPIPFQIYNSTNSACLTAPKGAVLCLPSGTYDTPDGGLGINAKDINAIDFPSGSSIAYTYPSIFDDGDAPSLVKQYPDQSSSLSNTSTTYNRSIAAGSGDSTDLNTNFILLQEIGDRFTLSVPASAPGVCLFTKTNYYGNVACFGLGASNITTSPIGTSAQSIKFHGNADAWIYSGKYGDLTGSFLNTDVPDLSAIPDGSVLNFANRIKAMWISLPT